MHQIFICYASLDKAKAVTVCEAIERHNVSCWIAHRNIPPGLPWPPAIVDAIAASNIFLLLISKNSNSSRHVLRELEQADRSQKHIVAIRIDDVLPSDGISYFISSTQWIDLFDEDLSKAWDFVSSAVVRSGPTDSRPDSQPLGIAPAKSAAVSDDAEEMKKKPNRIVQFITGAGLVLAAVGTFVTQFDKFTSAVCASSYRADWFCGQKTVSAAAPPIAADVQNAQTSRQATPLAPQKSREPDPETQVLHDEQEKQDAAWNDAGRLEDWLRTCRKCPKKESATTRLLELYEQSDKRALDAAKWDRTKLAVLKDAKTAWVSIQARRRLQVIVDEQQRYDSSLNDPIALKKLADGCEACLVRADALKRIAALAQIASATRQANAYVMLAVLDKNNNVRKRYFSIEGKPNSQFPAPLDFLVSEPLDGISVAIRAKPYHWDYINNRIDEGAKPTASVKKGERLQVAGNAYVSIDSRNGEQYIVVPVHTELMGDRLYDPIIPSAKIYGYAFFGAINDTTKQLDKPLFKIVKPKERANALYPAVNDELESLEAVNVRAGPYTWEPDKKDYYKPQPVGGLTPGTRVRVIGDVILAMGGRSIWIPVELAK